MINEKKSMFEGKPDFSKVSITIYPETTPVEKSENKKSFTQKLLPAIAALVIECTTPLAVKDAEAWDMTKKPVEIPAQK